MKRRVVITGLGAVTSLSTKVEPLWQRICAGHNGVVPITTSFDPTHQRVRFGGEISDWATDGYLHPKDAKRVDRFTQFALVGAIDAVRDSGLDFDKEDRFRCGVILGSGIGGLNEIETQHTRLLLKGCDKVSAFTIPKLIINAACGHVSIHFGLRGPNVAVATACASATNAMGDALKAIRYDEADVVISGGSEAAMTPMGVAGFAAMRALSERNDDPAHASRPFDKDRNGFVLSEGAGILIFEELEHARRRGARIYAEIYGYGASSDGIHITQPDENGTGAARAMMLALRDAKLDPVDVGYINAHGTSTRLNDLMETVAVKRVFGHRASSIPMSSQKSMVGHLIAASGALEAAATAMSLDRGVVPPTINQATPDPACDLDYVPNTAREIPLKTALSNSFGFGGQNASLVMARA